MSPLLEYNLLEKFRNELNKEREFTYSGVFSKQQPMRILFFARLWYWHTLTDRWFFFRYDAAVRHPFVDAVLWGPGFPGYDDHLSLRDNLVRTYTSPSHFHLLIAFEYNITKQIADVSQEVAVMAMRDEAWKATETWFNDMNASLLGLAYASEILQPLYQNFSHGGKVAFHIPKTVEPEVFYSPTARVQDDVGRDIDVLIIGAQSQYVYPVRWRVACALLKGQLEDAGVNYEIYHHPGYRELLTKDLKDFNITHATSQINTFAALMRRAKIVVSDSSRYHYGVGKYAEIPTAGALLFGDLPHEREVDFEKFVAYVGMEDPLSEVVRKLKWWLKNAAARHRKAALGQAITLSKYTNDHSIDIIISAYLRFKRKSYGTYFPYGFSHTCKGADPVAFNDYCPSDLNNYFGWTKETGMDIPGVLCDDIGPHLAPNLENLK